MTVPPGQPPNELEPSDISSDDENDLEVDDEDEERAASARSTIERILPELLRRGFEVGRAPLERVSESIFPKDIAANIASQLGDVRSGVVKAVAHEVGRFLREADIASEVRKVLTGLDIEASVKLRFKARDDGSIKPEVKPNTSSEPADKPRPSDRRKR